MKSTIGMILMGTFCGFVLGAVWAAVQTRPMEVVLPSPDTSAADDSARGGEVAQRPKAQLEETVYQFGSMEQGTSLAHVFLVRNVGGSPLHIEVGSTTCKCTVGDLSTSEVAPGKEAEVTLEWDR